MSVNNVLLIWGETKVASGYASLVIAMIPIFVALMETAFPGGETLNLRGWPARCSAPSACSRCSGPALHRAAPEPRPVAAASPAS